MTDRRKATKTRPGWRAPHFEWRALERRGRARDRRRHRALRLLYVVVRGLLRRIASGLRGLLGPGRP